MTLAPGDTAASTPQRPRRALGWLVHAFTASGAAMGLFALEAIDRDAPLTALWLMGAAVLIDGIDGIFARKVRIKEAVPEVDGALLDNIIDYFNYVIVPAYFLLHTDLLPALTRHPAAALIAIASAYQFSQSDAKTRDHFFKGFPSYWNIVVFYLFFWQLQPWINLLAICVLVVLVFVPIKYVYPTRMNRYTGSKILRRSLFAGAFVWGATTLALLWRWPMSSPILAAISSAYIIFYLGVSAYRTVCPLETESLEAQRPVR